jgi:hypothetical protein
LHWDTAAPKIAEAHAEVVAVCERMGIADEELGALMREGGPHVAEVVNARSLAALARGLEQVSGNLSQAKTPKKSAAKKQGS